MMEKIIKESSREGVIIIPVSLTIRKPDVLEVANCITAREDRGISKIQKIGNGVVTVITEKFLG